MAFSGLAERKLAIVRTRCHHKSQCLDGGSLLWEGGADFDRWHHEWRFDGPTLKLEFSRISSSRLGALTLVIDGENGSASTVAWCLSKRKDPADAAADLRCREGCSIRDVACLDLAVEGPHEDAITDIADWGRARRIDFIVGTALTSNFASKRQQPYTLEGALAYVQGLSPAAKVKAAEYVWRAPDFVRTPLRASLQRSPWFAPSANN